MADRALGTAIPPAEQKSLRCAIYTRKSTSEGLEGDFSTLDAQREAGENLVASRKGEGWVVLPTRYDDGGFSGGNMERPAMKRLLDDVGTGQVDCIVVYKVDRLSRSLLDFARIVAQLDECQVALVAVTQQFDTSSSLGRLTLNILLSFAQFEREIIAERTRDKMSAARRKGKWTGGVPVLGFDTHPKGGRIIVNHEEAGRVREIFRLYAEESSLLRTIKVLNERGWTTKAWVTKKGRSRKGSTFDKATLHRMLTNVVYIGKVNHKGTIYEGEHEAIVNLDLWGTVQATLQQNRGSWGSAKFVKHRALLRRILVCGHCNVAMTPTYTQKKNRRYRYYVCLRAIKKGWSSCPSKSLPAGGVEAFVVDQIRKIGQNDDLLARTLEEASRQHGDQVNRLQERISQQENIIHEGTREIERLSISLHEEIDDSSQSADRLTEQHTQVQEATRTMRELRAQLVPLQDLKPNPASMRKALREFEPIWEGFSPQEQARALHLLIEQVTYNGDTGDISTTFRWSGLPALASGLPGIVSGREVKHGE